MNKPEDIKKLMDALDTAHCLSCDIEPIEIGKKISDVMDDVKELEFIASLPPERRRKVKKDKHGLYVKMERHIFRPVPYKGSAKFITNPLPGGVTVMKEGTNVYVGFFDEHQLAVANRWEKEFWWCHGLLKGKSTERVWNPYKRIPSR